GPGPHRRYHLPRVHRRRGACHPGIGRAPIAAAGLHRAGRPVRPLRVRFDGGRRDRLGDRPYRDHVLVVPARSGPRSQGAGAKHTPHHPGDPGQLTHPGCRRRGDRAGRRLLAVGVPGARGRHELLQHHHRAQAAAHHRAAPPADGGDHHQHPAAAGSDRHRHAVAVARSSHRRRAMDRHSLDAADAAGCCRGRRPGRALRSDPADQAFRYHPGIRVPGRRRLVHGHGRVGGMVGSLPRDRGLYRRRGPGLQPHRRLHRRQPAAAAGFLSGALLLQHRGPLRGRYACRRGASRGPGRRRHPGAQADRLPSTLDPHRRPGATFHGDRLPPWADERVLHAHRRPGAQAIRHRGPGVLYDPIGHHPHLRGLFLPGGKALPDPDRGLRRPPAGL
ncbi:MAG: Inner membrane protein, KefB/KefC family, partial [Olavius algarvensis Gamma 1 endosymbiont]